jgi:uncharacterized protein YebE (UPF0316 family)
MFKSKRMRWAGYVAGMGRREMHIGFWWESIETKRPLGRPRCRWEDNIKMDIKEIGYGVTHWIHQDKDQWSALVNTVMNLRVP